MSDVLRAKVLSSVQTALRDAQEASLPPSTFAVDETPAQTADLVPRFIAELTALSGFATVVDSEAECVSAVSRYLHDREARSVAVQSSALAARIGDKLDEFEVSKAAERDKRELEKFDCGLLEARSLLADTGSAILLLDNSADRVLPYLPRTCIIVASVESLHSGMTPEAIASIESAANEGTGGEALIVAGPSRSADIEKSLVLGAHGPEALAVFMIRHCSAQ